MERTHMHFLNQKFRKTLSDYGAYKDYFGPLQEVYGFQ